MFQGFFILFDMYEEEKSLGTFRAVVRNIKPLEKLFRIGCQFFHMADEYTVVDDLMKKFFPSSLEPENPVGSESQPKIKTDAVPTTTDEPVEAKIDNPEAPEDSEKPEPSKE